MSTRVKGLAEFWPRWNENPNTLRVQNIDHFRELLKKITGLFVPGISTTTKVEVTRVIELENNQFMFFLKFPVTGRLKAITLPYQVFEDYGVYRKLDNVMELSRVLDSPPPWHIDKRIDSGGLQWTVDGKTWGYRAKQEDFMYKTYGYQSKPLATSYLFGDTSASMYMHHDANDNRYWIRIIMIEGVNVVQITKSSGDNVQVYSINCKFTGGAYASGISIKSSNDRLFVSFAGRADGKMEMSKAVEGGGESAITSIDMMENDRCAYVVSMDLDANFKWMKVVEYAQSLSCTAVTPDGLFAMSLSYNHATTRFPPRIRGDTAPVLPGDWLSAGGKVTSVIMLDKDGKFVSGYYALAAGIDDSVYVALSNSVLVFMMQMQTVYDWKGDVVANVPQNRKIAVYCSILRKPKTNAVDQVQYQHAVSFTTGKLSDHGGICIWEDGTYFVCCAYYTNSFFYDSSGAAVRTLALPRGNATKNRVLMVRYSATGTVMWYRTMGGESTSNYLYRESNFFASSPNVIGLEGGEVIMTYGAEASLVQVYDQADKPLLTPTTGVTGVINGAIKLAASGRLMWHVYQKKITNAIVTSRTPLISKLSNRIALFMDHIAPVNSGAFTFDLIDAAGNVRGRFNTETSDPQNVGALYQEMNFDGHVYQDE